MRTKEELIALYEGGELLVLDGREVEIFSAWLRESTRSSTDFNITISNRIMEPFLSPIDDTLITTKRQRAYEMQKHNCVDYEPTIVKRRRPEDER